MKFSDKWTDIESIMLSQMNRRKKTECSHSFGAFKKHCGIQYTKTIEMKPKRSGPYQKVFHNGGSWNKSKKGIL